MRFLNRKKRDHQTEDDLKFPGFEHSAEHLSCYMYALNIFIISLKNGDIIHYETDSPMEFVGWLNDHKIRNVTKIIKERAHNQN